MTINPIYLAQIKTAFPNLPLTDVTINTDGLVNDVLIVNNERVFRFPKSDWGRQALAKEAKVLSLAADYVDLPLPVFDYRHSDFVSYPFMKGYPLYRDDILRLDEPAQNRLAEQLALFLRQLHTIPLVVLEQHNISLSDALHTPARYRQLYEDAQRELFPLLLSDGREWLKRHFAPILQVPAFLDYKPALIHGDLAAYHILVNPARQQLSGVIDFGTAGIGDPANDVALLINSLGESFVQRMAAFYPDIHLLLNRARFMAGALEVEWVLGGIRTKDLS